MTPFLHAAENKDTEGIAACLPFNQRGQQDNMLCLYVNSYRKFCSVVDSWILQNSIVWVKKKKKKNKVPSTFFATSHCGLNLQATSFISSFWMFFFFPLLQPSDCKRINKGLIILENITVAADANSQHVKSICEDEVLQNRKEKLSWKFLHFPPEHRKLPSPVQTCHAKKISSLTIAKGRRAPLLHPQRGAARWQKENCVWR